MALSVFFSYAHQDRTLRDRLEDHLSNLKYRGLITTWHAGEVNAGEETLQQTDIHLNTAHIILLLISASFLATQYCYSQQMMKALQRHERGEANVIPVLLRPVVFTDAPFSKLKFLPSNKKPVVKWRDRDSAFVDITLGIEYIVRSRLELPSMAPHWEEKWPLPTRSFSPQDQKEHENVLRQEQARAHYYRESLTAYELALRQDNTDAIAHRGKGNTLVGLERYDEALTAFEQAVALMPHPLTYVRIGNVLTTLGRYDEAVTTYRQALALDASYAAAYAGMSKALLKLGSVQEAELAREQVKRFGDEDFDDS